MSANASCNSSGMTENSRAGNSNNTIDAGIPLTADATRIATTAKNKNFANRATR